MRNWKLNFDKDLQTLNAISFLDKNLGSSSITFNDSEEKKIKLFFSLFMTNIYRLKFYVFKFRREWYKLNANINFVMQINNFLKEKQ